MKKWIFLIIFVSTLVARCPKDSMADPVLGEDYYALQSKAWNLAASERYFIPNGALGSLDNTFGVQLDNVKHALASLRPSYYRVHIINTVCIRNSNCGVYEIGHGYSKASFDAAVGRKDPHILNPFKARVAAYRDLAAQFPGTKFVISPALEHDLSTASWRVLADATLSIFPNVQLANSADGGVPVERYQGAWIERHGSSPQPDADIVSLDGVSVTSVNIEDIKARSRNAKILFAWDSGFNLRNDSGPFVDPRNRSSAYNADQHELLAHIFDARPAAPAFSGNQCKSIKPFAAPRVNKPFAEKGPGPDSRAWYPVVILEGKAAAIHVYAANGGLVGTLGLYGTYDPLKMFRYYSRYKGGSNQSGYQWEKAAVSATGNPNTWFEVNHQCWGPVIGGQRGGSFK